MMTSKLEFALIKAPAAPGIYKLLNRRSGKCYVGQARNIRARLGQHLRQLKAGKHKNPVLTAAWAKYPESDWEFVVAQLCPAEELTRWEAHWAKETGALVSGYNCAPIQSGVDVTPAFRAIARASAFKYHARVGDLARTNAALKAAETRRRMKAAQLAAEANASE